MDFSNNRKKNQAKNIKTQIITFFVKELQIKLKAKKTKIITSYFKGFKFLGFEIKMQLNETKFRKVLTKTTKKEKDQIFRKTLSKKITGFSIIMKSLRRKRIPCCRQCHLKIHKVLYDRIAFSDSNNP